tara:strand:- start:149 stop:397 length:249 start_codon:yes stop_codon:yes gene_type:complete
MGHNMTATNLELLIMAVGFASLLGPIILAKRALGEKTDPAPRYPSLSDMPAKQQKDRSECNGLDFLSIDQVDIHKWSNMRRD